MIDRNHDLPVVRQCQILELARSTAYYTPKPTSPEDLALMRLGRWRHQLAQRLEHLLQLRPRILTEGLPPPSGPGGGQRPSISAAAAVSPRSRRPAMTPVRLPSG